MTYAAVVILYLVSVGSVIYADYRDVALKWHVCLAAVNLAIGVIIVELFL